MATMDIYNAEFSWGLVFQFRTSHQTWRLLREYQKSSQCLKSARLTLLPA